MQSQRILLIITKSNFGGAQRYVHELACALQAQGHVVGVASGGSEGELIRKLHDHSIPHYPIKYFQRDISIFKEVRAVHELRCVMREFKPDIVHLNSSKAGGLGALAARWEGIKTIVFTAHGWPFLEPRNWLWRSMAWILSILSALLTHKIIVVSENDYHHTPKLLRKKTQVIYPGIDTIPFLKLDLARYELEKTYQVPFSRNPDSTWFVSTGELNHNKNIKTAITAVALHNQTSDNKIYVSVVGTGELHDALAAHIQTTNMTEYIQLVGYVADIRTYLLAYDGFIMTSRKEGFPYGLLEACAARLAIIASDVGGIPELLGQPPAGILVSPTNTETIAQALSKCSDASGRMSYTSKTAERSAAFTLDNMCRETIAYYGA